MSEVVSNDATHTVKPFKEIDEREAEGQDLTNNLQINIEKGVEHELSFQPESEAGECSDTEQHKRKRKAKIDDVPKKRHFRKQVPFDASVYQTTFEDLKSGSICVFGQGDAGQLGLGSDCVEAPEPKYVNVNDFVFKQICCGGMHSLALSDSGRVYSCGCNDEGALGRTASGDSEFCFKEVELPKNVFIVKVVAGDSFSIALTDRGVIFGWGSFRDSNGSIGLMTLKKAEHLPKVLYQKSDKCVDICGGTNHILFLTSGGRIFSCGSSEEGQLGRVPQLFSVRGGRRGISELLAPKEVVFISLSQRRRSKVVHGACVKRIFATNCGSFVELVDGSVFGWGLNASGQLLIDGDEMLFFPVNLSGVFDKLSLEGRFEPFISGGYMHTLVLDPKSGVIYSGGNHFDCCLGRSDLSPSFKPIDVPKPAPFFNTCSCGDTCCFAISSTGKLYSWGLGCTEQLGFGHGGDVTAPTLVSSGCLGNKKVLQVSPGGQHTAVLFQSIDFT